MDVSSWHTPGGRHSTIEWPLSGGKPDVPQAWLELPDTSTPNGHRRTADIRQRFVFNHDDVSYIFLLGVIGDDLPRYLGTIVDGTNVMASNTAELDGTELQYTYEDGGEVVLTFYDGMVKFEWLHGPLAGTKHQDLAYLSREIDEQVYLIRWHNREVGSFVTLYIDLPGKRIFGSALTWYNSDEPFELFDSAVITRVDVEK